MRIRLNWWGAPRVWNKSGTSGAPTDPSCESVEEADTDEVARVEVEGDEFQVGELS